MTPEVKVLFFAGSNSGKTCNELSGSVQELESCIRPRRVRLICGKLFINTPDFLSVSTAAISGLAHINAEADPFSNTSLRPLALVLNENIYSPLFCCHRGVHHPYHAVP